MIVMKKKKHFIDDSDFFKEQEKDVNEYFKYLKENSEKK